MSIEEKPAIIVGRKRTDMDGSSKYMRVLDRVGAYFRQLWWAFTGKLEEHFERYARYQALRTDVMYGLAKMEHLRRDDKLTLGLTHKISALYTLCVGKFDNLFEIDDKILLTKDGRDKVVDVLLACACSTRRDIKGMYEDFIDLASRVRGLEVSRYSVPACLASPDCAAFDN